MTGSNEHVPMGAAEQFLFSDPNVSCGYGEIFSKLEENYYKKKDITLKVRQENRERKKRWRQQNKERNKDNDLRCRVNKRATRLFGKEESAHKQTWIAQEFIKRKDKRMNKEEQSCQVVLNNSIDHLSLLSTKQDKSEQFTTQLLELFHQQNDFSLKEPVVLEPIIQPVETEVKPAIDYPMEAVLTLMQLNAGWCQ